MTDHSDTNGPKLPPKIKLNLNTPADTPPPPPVSPAESEVPPKAKISLKPTTTTPPADKMNLNVDDELKTIEEQIPPQADAPEPSGEKKKPMIKLNFDTAGGDQDQDPSEVPDTTPSQPAKAGATPEKADAAPPEKPKIKLGLSGLEVAHADQTEDDAKQTSQPEESTPPATPQKPALSLKNKPTPAPVDQSQAEIVEAESADEKSIQIQDIEGESLDDLYQAALNATQRVILDEKEKAATNKIAIDEAQTLKKAELAEASKKSTARLDLAEMLSDDERSEIMKHETMHINTDGSAPRPSGTMKIQRPATPPPEAMSDSTMAIPLDLEESKKSETARIELPRDIASSKPASGRKTIRIKRPDGGGVAATRPALSVARTSASAPDETAPTATAEAARAAISFDTNDEEVDSPAFAAVALVAVLVGLALVYVLAATLVPALPFPGRLV